MAGKMDDARQESKEPVVVPLDTEYAGDSLGNKVCSACRAVNDIEALYCYKCGMKLPDRIQFGTESVGPPAGFWTRLVAHFVDQILLGILVFVLNMIVAGSLVDTYSDGALYFDWYTVPKFMWWLISITVILEVLYFTVAISTWGKTIGKAMLGIKVVRQDGSRISYARSLVRCVIYLLQLEFVIGLSFIVIAFNPKKQGIHDMICDTGVVRV